MTVIGVVLVPWLGLSRAAARGWDAEALLAASGACAVLVAVGSAASVRSQLEANELFSDLGAWAAWVPGTVGTAAGGVVGLSFAVALAVLMGVSAPITLVPLATLSAFAVRPRPNAASAKAARTPRVRWPSTALRVFASGAFSPPRLLAALAALLFGIVGGHAAAAEGAEAARVAVCAIAAVLAGGLLADPSGWLQAAWQSDGTRARTKASRPVLAWLGAVGAAGGLMAGALGAFALAAALGAAFLAWRLAYAGDDGAAWRDGALAAVGVAVTSSVAPPAVALVALGAGLAASLRARQRVAPRV